MMMIINLIITDNGIEYENKYLIEFDGDCALNVLTCVKNQDIQKWLIIKKEIINNNNYLKNYNYKRKIKDIFNKFDTDEAIKKDIIKYIDDYKSFIDNFSKYNTWLDNEESTLENLELFIDCESAIISILMEHDKSKDLIEYIENKNYEHCKPLIKKIIEKLKANKDYKLTEEDKDIIKIR